MSPDPDRPAGPDLPQVGAGGRVPNSGAQADRLRMLAEQGQVGLLRHCLTLALDIVGPLRPEPIQAALDEVAARHPALRSEFRPGRPDHVVDAAARIMLRTVVVTGSDPHGRWAEAGRAAYADSMVPFDVTRPPLVRATLLATDHERHLLVLSFDQLVIDAWSADLVVTELVVAADRFIREADGPARGAGGPAAVVPDAYPQLRAAGVRWEGGPECMAAVAERRLALAGAHRRFPVSGEPDSTDPDELAHHTVCVPDDVSGALARRASGPRMTVFPVALTALAAALADRADRPDPNRHLLSSTYACREDAVEEAVVGWLSNDVPLVLPPVRGTVAEYLTAVRSQLIAALQYQRITAARVVPPDPGGPGLTVSALYLPAQLSGAGQAVMSIGAARVSRRAVSVCPTGNDLDLFVVERPVLMTGENPLLALGGTGRRTVVGRTRLAAILDRWCAAIGTLAGAGDWADLPVTAVRLRTREGV